MDKFLDIVRSLLVALFIAFLLGATVVLPLTGIDGVGDDPAEPIKAMVGLLIWIAVLIILGIWIISSKLELIVAALRPKESEEKAPSTGEPRQWFE